MAVRGYNKLIICGRLGADPEINTKATIPVCQLSVATPGRIVNGEQTVEWIKVVCFGKTAEIVDKHMKKGREVLIEGRLQTDKYVDKQGVNRSSTKCIANQVLFVGSNPDVGHKEEKYGVAHNENASKSKGESYDFGGEQDAYSPF